MTLVDVISSPMPFDSLLIPHDGSQSSGTVVDALLPLLRPGTTVTLLRVNEDDAQEDAGVAETRQRLEALGVTVTRRDVTSSDPAGAILDVAADLHPDLVAMSAHGRSGVRHRVRGGVADRVLRACPTAVFMVNPVTHPKAQFRSALVPLEHSDESAQILDTVIPLAQAFDARLTLLHVDFDDPTVPPATRERRRAMRAEDVNKWLSKPRARAEAAGITVELRIVHGDPAEQILQVATPQDYDWLAMTTHARSGLTRWLLGSVTEKVLRECEIPVLLHRTGLSDAG